MRILSLNYETALGSAVHATPVFNALKTLRPDWEIHVACSGLPSRLFSFHPGISKMYITDQPIQSPVKVALQMFKIFFFSKFDAVLINTGNCRPKIAWNSLFLRSKKRIGVSVDGRFVDISLNPVEGQSVAANNLLVLKPLIPELDIEYFANNFEIYFGIKQKEKVLAFRRNILKGRNPVIGFVTQTSGGQPSQWKDSRFYEVATQLENITGCSSVFLGTAGEAPRIERIISPLKNAVSLAGDTNIEEIAAYCASFDLLITLDSGIMHVGTSVGVPMVVIAPAWQPAFEWLPLGREHISILRRWDIGCRHCRKFNCETHECMEEISVLDVVTAALKQLKQFPPSEKNRTNTLVRWTNA